MPTIYLSPSTQEYNAYVNGGNEEYYMNLVAGAMEPYLRSSGIQFTRNTPDMTAASSIRQSNAGQYDLHVALHSNASPPSLAGVLRGIDVYHAPGSVAGTRAAEIIADHLREIYPLPDQVRPLSSSEISEVNSTWAPAVLIEYAYHDNPDDAIWIKTHINQMARATVQALTEYFGIPFVEPMAPEEGRVRLESGRLNIRSRPSTDSDVIAQAQNGDPITILGRWDSWDVVNYRGTVGYAASEFIQP